jgi:hypothetical protein
VHRCRAAIHAAHTGRHREGSQPPGGTVQRAEPGGRGRVLSGGRARAAGGHGSGVRRAGSLRTSGTGRKRPRAAGPRGLCPHSGRPGLLPARGARGGPWRGVGGVRVRREPGSRQAPGDGSGGRRGGGPGGGHLGQPTLGGPAIDRRGHSLGNGIGSGPCRPQPGSSHRLGEVGGAKHPFDDREVARNVLRSLAEAP